MSDHFCVEGREGCDSHFLDRAVVRVLSGISDRRWALLSGVAKGFCSRRIWVAKKGFRRLRERLRLVS